MKRRFLAIILVMLMAVGALAGCSKEPTGSDVTEQSGNAGETKPADSQAQSGTEDKKPVTSNGDSGTKDDGKPAESQKTPDTKDDKNTGEKTSDEKTPAVETPVVDADSLKAEILAKISGPNVVFSSANDIKAVALNFLEDGTCAFDSESTLYSNDITLTVNAPAGAKVYYTFDGSIPTAESEQYSSALTLEARGGSFPEAYVFRAVAIFEDGSVSKTAARSFIVSSKLEGRFSTVIFSVSGDPADLTEKPDGIFYGQNYNMRGRESERPVYVEAWEPDGTNIISQFAGVRIYGGYSRQNSIKSMKLFARKSYDEENKNFKFSDFGTAKLDGSDKTIKKYDKLVLRDCGNDLQFSYVRDELSQTLCKLAGFDCYEAVLPAVAYLNGEYYGLFWLHENYTDKYFKEKFGDAAGEFIVAEGSEKHKSDDDDPVVQAAVDEYNTKYEQFCEMDLTDDANFKQVTDFIDVESYLDFMAWNIALNNWDWPNNNYKCYKYVEADAAALAAEGAAKTPDSPAFDGRWRFLPHDMDYSYGLYDQTETLASYNTLKVVLNKNSNRYAPLFAKLMDRKDCRSYFRAKTQEFINGALSEDVIVAAYNYLHASRTAELDYFYEHLQQLNRKGDWSIWSQPGHYAGYEQQILNFAKGRGRLCLKQMDNLLPELE